MIISSAVLRRLTPYGIALFMLSSPLIVQAAPVCGADVKETVAKTLAPSTTPRSEADQLSLESSVYQKYKYCSTDGSQVPTTDPFYVAARQCGARVSYLGSTYFEEMPCCGYDPQRRTFACPIRVKQGAGFGVAPLPGSRLFVLNCVLDTNGVYQPVGVDSVHLANSALPPSWQFAVVANANRNLQLVQPMNGQQRNARSILSWNMQPTSCSYQPIWGNVIDYKIRLDQ